MREQPQKWLYEWFAGRGKIGPSGHENLIEIDYFAAGWLTSMEIVEFVMEIERQFEVQFSETDLKDRRFVTIGGLAQLILEHTTQPSQSR